MKVFAKLKWFLVSSASVILIAIFLSKAINTSSGVSGVNIINNYPVVWMLLRGLIVIGFYFLWPIMVKHWAKLYQWKEEYKNEVTAYRNRYIVWLLIVFIIIQFL